MAEFYRFRSMKYLLGEKYRELEKQTIYFASPEELNDPVEGLRDIAWIGDEIVWTNLFKHYVYCLHQTYFLFRITGGSRKLDACNISIFGRWDDLPTPEAQTLFDDIWMRCLNVPNIQEIIEALANVRRKIKYRELGYYFRPIHPVFLEQIMASYLAHGIISESEMPKLTDEFPVSATLELILYSIKLTREAKTEVETEIQLDRAFLAADMRDNDERIKHQLDNLTNLTGSLRENYQLVICDFPKVYLKQLEKLLWPEWYTACFARSYHNSSIWGNYGNGHKGVCLIFESIDKDASHSLELNQDIRNRSGEITFREVSYDRGMEEVDFFRFIGLSPLPVSKELWYSRQDGEISECTTHIGSECNEDTQQQSYWDDFFFRQITSKTKDWEYEKESRLILHECSELYEKDNRALTYNFNSLKGIIFGIKISDVDRLKIIEIIQKKCRDKKRTDFKFFQAYYSQATDEICKHEIKLSIAPNSLFSPSNEELGAKLALELGNQRLIDGQIDAAIEAYSSAIRLRPDYVEAYKNRRTAYHRKGDYDRAYKDFKKTFQLDPDSVIADLANAMEANSNSAET